METLNDPGLRFALLQDMIQAHRLTHRVIAEHFGLSVKTVGHWCDTAGFKQPIPARRLHRLLQLYPTAYNRAQLPELAAAP